ncbi:MAG: hypothetical protein IJD71_00705 [Clostridia bacterium]|nr:hypothetical protein [Clostridia bacterium]
MAERKKVQKIKPKKAIQKPKKAVQKPKKASTRTESIKMTSDNTKPKSTPVRKKQVNHSSEHIYEREQTVKKNPQTSKVRKKYNGFSVIKGNKAEIEKKKLISICITVVVVLSILIFCLTSPTGPVERITNAFELIGGGEFPATLAGTKINSVTSVDNKVYALTNSHLCAYNFSGKNFLQIQHNFSNPVLSVSKERALIYNRESNKFLISNNSGVLFEQNLEKPIYCADISNNGSVAFACESASYSAQVLVFDKNMKQYYTWYLADGLISDVAISNNGKYLAVAVLMVKNGAYFSKIYCLDTDEKDPIFVKELSDETVYSVDSVSSSNFVCTSNKKVSFFKWKTGENVNPNSFNAPSYFNKGSRFNLAVYGEANHSDIILLNSSGEVKNQFEYNGIIDSISVFDDNVYILNGNKITYFDFETKTQKTINLDSSLKYILGVNNGILGIDNTSINYISLESN